MNSAFQTRCIILCSILVVGLSVLSARLVQIQLVDRQRYAESSRKAYHRTEKLPATRAAVPGFRVAGKTGTVQKHNPKGGYFANSYIVSFAGMMPAEDPAFVCIVVIDDPRTQKVTRYGGTIAAPAFSKIATRVASHMNLQPTEPISPSLAAAAR